MKTIDFIMIADRWCPTSRTYLTYLHHAGFRMRKIVLVDFIGKNKRLRNLRRMLGSTVAGKIITRRRPQWPYNDPKGLFDIVQAGVEHHINYTQPFDFHAYSADVQEIVAEDYEDIHLHACLKNQPVQTFLYTNGGRVPAVLLAQPGLKIFHIHPGIVPYVRGSDGLLWSILTRGRPGVSCFYMNDGIDTGNVIGRKEFPLPNFSIKAPKNLVEEDELYRALLIAYDPHLRASLMRDIIVENNGENLNNLAFLEQPSEKLSSYLWMHPLMRMKTLSLVTQ